MRGGLGYDGYVTDPKSPAKAKEIIDGCVNTGDMGHLDHEGRLYIYGRDDDMIVSGGENVFPGEIEDLLYEHPAVTEAAVIGVPDDEFGQRLAAFVIPVGDITEAEVKLFVREHLARFKVPRDVHLVDDLPRTATGKIHRSGLVALARSEGPDNRWLA